MASDQDSDRREAGRASAEHSERVVPMRVQKFLARSGVASRRGCEDLMTAGRVAVNGVVTTELGAKVDPAFDTVTVDGVFVRLADEPVYLALSKPPGVVTTMSDPQGRPTVATLVPSREFPGLFPVGRLDFDTTGLLLFTTDGEISHRLLHPRWKVEKTYVVLADGQPDERDIERLSTGIQLDDGMTAPARVRTLDRRAGRTLLEISITEGRKRQIRRMFSAVSHPVIELHRLRFGPVELGMLAPGTWRHLSAEEVAGLRSVVGMGE
jgi:23S rRNA pseudouridine2605 synthase